MKRILISGGGANGFIGRNLAESLLNTYQLYAPSSQELNLCCYDDVAYFIETNKIDVIIHGAHHNVIKRGSENAMLFDLQMFYNLEKLSNMVDKFIYFGSGAEFDKRQNISMIKEEDFGRNIPNDYYGLEKYMMNLTARKSKNIYNLRLFGIYGKYEYWPLKFISNLCCKAVYDLPLSIRQNCKFDFLYISDLNDIVKWFVENTPKYHDYNVCMGSPVELYSIAEIVNMVSGKRLPIHIQKTGWNLEYTADNTRLRNEMKNLNISDMQKSIVHLYEYYMRNRFDIDKVKLEQSR